MAKDNMSFLPEDYVERRIEQRTNLICLSLFVVVLLGIGAAYTVTTNQRAEVREQAKQVDTAFTEAAQRLEQLEELQNRRTQMLSKAQVASTLLEPIPRTFLMADLINRMPPTLTLFDVTLDSKLMEPRVTRRIGAQSALAAKTQGKDEEDDPLAPPPVPRYEVTLAMVGVAPTDVQVAQYMSTLSKSHLVSDVSLVFSERTEINEVTMRRFRVEMTLDPAADVRRMDPLELKRDIGRDLFRTPELDEQDMLKQAADDDDDEDFDGEEEDEAPIVDGLEGADHLDNPIKRR